MAQNRRLAEEVARLRAEVKRLEEREDGYYTANLDAFRRLADVIQDNEYLRAELARKESA